MTVIGSGNFTESEQEQMADWIYDHVGAAEFLPRFADVKLTPLHHTRIMLHLILQITLYPTLLKRQLKHSIITIMCKVHAPEQDQFVRGGNQSGTPSGARHVAEHSHSRPDLFMEVE